MISVINECQSLEFMNLSSNTIGSKYIKHIDNILHANHVKLTNERLKTDANKVSKYKDSQPIIDEAEKDIKSMKTRCELIKKHQVKVEAVRNSVIEKEKDKTKLLIEKKDEVNSELKAIEDQYAMAETEYAEAEEIEQEKVKKVRIKGNELYRKNQEFLEEGIFLLVNIVNKVKIEYEDKLSTNNKRLEIFQKSSKEEERKLDYYR